LLLNAVYSKSQYRQDGLLAGPFDTIAPGSITGAPANAQVPYGFEIYDDTGDRKRLGVAAALQWQASDDVLLTAQYQGTKYWFNRTGAYYYDYNNRTNVRDAERQRDELRHRSAAGRGLHVQRRRLCDQGFTAQPDLRDRPLRSGAVEREPELHAEPGLAGERSHQDESSTPSI
jgi:iron complex outermembrane receptor protein